MDDLKSFLRNYWWIILIVIIILFSIAVPIHLLKTRPEPVYPQNLADHIFNFLDDWASAGAPVFTLLLAIAAFWAIWQTRSIQKRESKQRLLNEIIEWAIDVTSANFGGEILITPGVSEMIQKRRDSANRLLRCQVLVVKGKELIKTSALSIDKDLEDAVTKVLDSLDVVRDILSRGMPFIESKEAKDTLIANNSVLEQNIRDLLNSIARYRANG